MNGLRAGLLSFLWAGAKRRVAAEQPTIIAVTGSVGKTSTKDAIAAVLAKSGRPVFKTPGSLNTESGVALSLLGFEAAPDGMLEWISAFWLALFPPHTPGLGKGVKPYYVLEYSTDTPGDIAYLVRQIPPQIAVLTVISPAHTHNFPRFEDLVKEKLSLLTGLPESGLAVLNADDPNQKGLTVPTLWYGLGNSEPAGVQTRDITETEQGLSCAIEYRPGRRHMDTIGKQMPQSIYLKTQVLGRQHLYSLTAAAAIGFKEGISGRLITEALEAYQLPKGRGRLIPGRKDVLLVDDTYNSSPEAVKAGLDMLRPYAEGRRIIAILGQMNELGEHEAALHREVALYAAKRVDMLVTVGPQAAAMAAAAQEAGLTSDHCLAFDTIEHLIDKLDQVVQRRDLVYIKASQNGMRLERVVKALMEHPEEARNLLVRQTGAWARR